ncbi:unnamed protein product [Caenorhabditis nigoni]
MPRNDQYEKAIKFISNSIKNYTEPESLERWCESARTEAGYDKSAHSFSCVIRRRLDRIEDLHGLTLMEKIRLVFIFSRPVSPGFLKILKDNKCVVELNDSRRITYFSSPDGDCALQSEQDSNPTNRKFKGKSIQPKTRITRRLDNIEDLQGLTLMEKVRLAFIFSRRVSAEFVEELEDNNCIVKLNDSRRITYFRSEDREIVLQLEHKKTAEIQVKTPHNVLAQKLSASPQSLPDPPEIDDVEMGNEKEEETQEQENQESEAPGMKEEINRDTSTNEKSILNTEEDVDVTTERIQQEPTFNGPIDYDDLDIEEYPEFMVPNEIEPPMQHNKRHPDLSQENPKRRKIDDLEEPEVANPPEINDVEIRNVVVEAAQEQEKNSKGSNEPSSGVDNESNNQNQVASVGDKSIDDKHAQNLVQITQKRVKIEEFLEEIEQPPEVWIPDEKPGMPHPTISLLKLTEQIETLAYINFDQRFQQKALRAVRMFKAGDKTIPIQDFKLLFNVLLASLKRERTENSNENSMQMSRIFKQLQRMLIRPLGDDLMAETLGILDDEIQKLGEVEQHIPLKTVEVQLDSFMTLITSSWANLDQ